MWLPSEEMSTFFSNSSVFEHSQFHGFKKIIIIGQKFRTSANVNYSFPEGILNIPKNSDFVYKKPTVRFFTHHGSKKNVNDIDVVTPVFNSFVKCLCQCTPISI